MNSVEATSDKLLSKILYIQSSVDNSFRLILNPLWKSAAANHRQLIRECLATQFSSHFSRLQLAQLNDLTWRPQASDGSISISHCRALGGFAFSVHKCGFDVEEIKRISSDILKRTCTETELSEAPQTEFLWCAKEAGFKALSTETGEPLNVGDLQCYDWQSHFENQVFSFRLKSEKTLDFGLNKGFIFSEREMLFALFFR
jgi:hypothetical protein